MTEKQIADLRSIAAEAAREAEADQGTAEAGVNRHGAFIDHDVLTRLLDEREALLEHLRKLRRELPFDGPRERGVAEAIAKAEEDSRT